MNKNFLLIIILLIIIGTVIFLYNKNEISRFISVINEKNLLDKFNFDNIDYSKNVILNYNIKKLYNTNYFEIKEVDIDGTILANNILLTIS
jgi:uncharacterized protein YxeA